MSARDKRVNVMKFDALGFVAGAVIGTILLLLFLEFKRLNDKFDQVKVALTPLELLVDLKVEKKFFVATVYVDRMTGRISAPINQNERLLVPASTEDWRGLQRFRAPIYFPRLNIPGERDRVEMLGVRYFSKLLSRGTPRNHEDG